MFTEEKIENLANKLLIGLSKEETTMIYEEFDAIDKDIDQINEIDGLDAVEPLFMPYDLYMASLREDEALPSVDIEDILANAKEVDGREIKVPKVVGNE